MRSRWRERRLRRSPSGVTARARRGAGNHEDIRIQALTGARRNGNLDRMIALADRCMSDYDEAGWTDPHWLNPDPRR